MDDVLLDTLARTLAEAILDGLSGQLRDDFACFFDPRPVIAALLAVTGDDGVPLLTLASDWEQIACVAIDASGSVTKALARMPNPDLVRSGWIPAFIRPGARDEKRGVRWLI